MSIELYLNYLGALSIFRTELVVNKSKRTNKQQVQDEIDDARYHWEFLRRCDKFRHDFQVFSRKYGEEGPACGFHPEWIIRECHKLGEDPSVAAPGCFMDRLAKDQRKFRARWGIDPTNPESNYPPFLRDRTSWISDHVCEYTLSSEQVNKYEITLSIDLRRPEAEIIKSLRWRVRWEQERRKLTPKRKSRKRPDSYDDYLRAHDLSQEGKTDKEIAQDSIMLSRAKEKNVAMNPKRVLEYRNKAALLIAKARNGTW
jgi:hypothetical protein